MFPGGWKLEAVTASSRRTAPCLSPTVYLEIWFRTLAAEEDEWVLLWEECMLDTPGHGTGTSKKPKQQVLKSLVTAPCPGQRHSSAGQKFLLASSLALVLQWDSWGLSSFPVTAPCCLSVSTSDMTLRRSKMTVRLWEQRWPRVTHPTCITDVISEALTFGCGTLFWEEELVRSDRMNLTRKHGHVCGQDC